jgi:hypothetical protein
VNTYGGFRPGGGYRPGVPVARPGYTGFGAGYGRPPVAHGPVGGPYVQRGWAYGGRSYMHGYRPYGWGYRSYYAYSPGYRFHPGFYRYYYTPWARPIHYSWGWYGSPWYSSYGYYWNPYPYYAAPAYWLTDWLIADLLAAQYAEAANASAAAAAAQSQYYAQAQAAPMSEDLKDQVRREVDEAVRAQQSQQPLTIGSALQDPSHIYAVSQPVGVTLQNGSGVCSLSAGDLLRVATTPAAGDPVAAMTVVSAKKGSCPVGSVVTVSVSDLQTFLNDFSERLEQGMQQMQQAFPSSQQAPVNPYEATPSQPAPAEPPPAQYPPQ